MELPALAPKTIVKLTVPAVVALLGAIGVFSFLQIYTAYRSPLYGAGPAWTPRTAGLADLEDWSARKAERERQRQELLANLDTEKMVVLGKEIVHGRGLCFNCHMVGAEGHGTRGPNLEGVGERAGSRIAGKNDVAYLTESLYKPGAFIVPGFVPAMTPVNEAPIDLDDLEILMVIAYLQSLGGTPTVGPDTKLPLP